MTNDHTGVLLTAVMEIREDMGRVLAQGEMHGAWLKHHSRILEHLCRSDTGRSATVRPNASTLKDLTRFLVGLSTVITTLAGAYLVLTGKAPPEVLGP